VRLIADYDVLVPGLATHRVDHRDLALEDMAADLARATEERDTYRWLFAKSLDFIRERHLEFERLRDSHQRLLDEFRRMRETIRAGAA